MMIVFERSRRIAAPPDRVWLVVSDVTRWPEWFMEAERCEVLSGAGVGQRQRMYGHARGKATEIDSVITFWTPPTLLRWHHEAERVGGQPGSVVFAKDATAQISIDPVGDADSIVTYRLELEAGSLRNQFMLRILAPRPIGKSFETSLAQLAALV
jgi:uncharacterized protein YndB with AHSA1/START domain